MKCIQIKNEVKTYQYSETSNHIQMKGGAAAAGAGTLEGDAGGPPAAAVPFHLYMV